MFKGIRALGIDSGSATISIALIEKGEGGLRLVKSAYAFHRGKPAEAIRDALAELSALGIAQVDALRVCSRTPSRVRGERIDSLTAYLEAARRDYPGMRTLLVVGAEKFSRVSLARNGAAPTIRGNSSCAAGTGSFLDQQASRLGLSGSAELAELALASAGARPDIASRCSVFAKTDLIHAQAEGWSLGEICAGLCAGLARNIADTLFPGELPQAPILMAGGVSRNAAVVRELSALAGSEIRVSADTHLYGAYGAALRALAEASGEHIALDSIVAPEGGGLSFDKPPLDQVELDYPDFRGLDSYLFRSRALGPANPVEVDIYEDIEGRDIQAWIGIDVGSTSTKAALVSKAGAVLAGFYARTAGRPVEAAQALLDAMRDAAARKGARVTALGAATTGSGRKLVKELIGADAAIDEISAHARAAAMLDPEVDTIIEIGGQDSKFTSLSKGIVVYSQMNTVCAAGTGSFIEEQAARLGVPLREYSARALGARAPMSSDRCTVFMERDLNQLQAAGYGVDELLAAALHSVCENYMSKVAQEGLIGRRVCFQGATAKNKALVAAFSARIGKPVRVSRFCHITGAVGAALVAADEAGRAARASSFKGFGVADLEVKSRGERCELCANKCRLRILKAGDEELAFGFLCGRDWGTKRYVAKRKLAWDLLAARKAIAREAFAVERVHGGSKEKARRARVKIGVSSSLYMADDAEGWAAFLERLGFGVARVADSVDALKEGKRKAGAEFCAPMAYAYGELSSLLEACHFAFFPTYLEREAEAMPRQAYERRRKARRMLCNYSQFSTVTVPHALPEGRRVLSPLVEGWRRGRGAKAEAILKELDRAARIVPFPLPSKLEILEALRQREAGARAKARALKEAYLAEMARTEGPVAILVGRPYNALAPEMNKGIPGLLAEQGLPVFFQDMLPELDKERASEDLLRLLGEFHWDYAAQALKAAAYCAAEPRAYPVYVTCFKCSPDSFALTWFKEIMDAAGKPYLVLQIDEHDSGVGYETRVEAGARAFRNHWASSRAEPPDASAKAPGSGTAPPLASSMDGKTLIFPNWDPLVAPLFAAAIRRVGLDARVIDETPELIRRSMSHNSGQCIPISIIAEEAIDYVRSNGLEPSKTLLWMMDVQWPCNIPLYPRFIKAIFDKAGMKELNVYRGDLTCLDISPKAMVGAYLSFTLGGTLRRLGCRVRPYERMPGATDKAIAETLADLVATFESGAKRGPALTRMIDRFEAIETQGERRPLVAIFGDFYSRDNEVFNQDLIKAIEAAGGEVITATYIDYAKSVADASFKRLWAESRYYDAAAVKASVAAVQAIDEAFFVSSGERRVERSGWRTKDLDKKLAAFGVKPEHEGECFDNLFKVARIVEEHPEVSLFVQASPAFCCPSVITESMRPTLERILGVPVIPITYDGTGEPKNDAIAAYLELSRARMKK
jgi:predicted CoA-substrate-specific enzyme activase